MFTLFEANHRRARDDQDIGYFFDKYGVDAPTILSERAEDSSLSSRDRRHWRRLARKARGQRSKWMERLTNS
ncbi:MAG: hypothetical protein COA41_03205 [Sphingopyxis sp.]|nr:MAG: hypothetical protein COA41_03205 [Sphingopyxis sp.]